MEADDLIDGSQASDRPALMVIGALAKRLRDATEKLERGNSS